MALPKTLLNGTALGTSMLIFTVSVRAPDIIDQVNDLGDGIARGITAVTSVGDTGPNIVITNNISGIDYPMPPREVRAKKDRR